MMYYILKETTDWDHKVSNGTYIFAEKLKGRVGKAIGFIPCGTDVVKWFSKGLDIDMKYRTFIEVGKLSKRDTAILL